MNAVFSIAWFMARFPLDAIIILFLYHVYYAVRPDDFHHYEPWETSACHGPRKDALPQAKEMLLDQETIFKCGEEAKSRILKPVIEMKSEEKLPEGCRLDQMELESCPKRLERQCQVTNRHSHVKLRPNRPNLYRSTKDS